jgi:YggT family protein
MRIVMNILASLTGLYMLLAFIRIMLTWFGSAQYGKPAEILGRITDPYLDWWRRSVPIRAGSLDLSPIAGMVFLSLLQNIFSVTARFGSISLGIILAIILSAVWSALSALLGFFLIVLILRFIAYITNRNIYGVFWHVVDLISQPILYRINRLFFKNRIINYLSSLILSSLFLLALLIAGNLAVRAGSELLLRLPF